MSDRLQKRILLDDGAARRLFLAYSRDDLDAVTELFSANKKADLHLVKPFDDVASVAEVEAKLAAAERKQASTTQEFIDIGRMLSERKVAGKRDGSIPHGEWVPWLERNFPSVDGRDRVRRLQQYKQVAEYMDSGEEAKTKVSSLLPQGFDAVLNEFISRPSRLQSEARVLGAFSPQLGCAVIR